MKMIKYTYLNWSFNTSDEMQMRIWYGFFSNLSEEEFCRMVETYRTTNIHAPNSPNDLLMVLVEEDEKKFEDPHRAFAKVRQLIRDNGWQYGRQDI